MAEETVVIAPDNTQGTTPENTLMTTDETKPTDSNADAGKTEAVVEYADFKLPETFEIDTEILGNFKNVAKELKLSQEQAQKLVDMQVEMSKRQSKAHETAWGEVQKDWRTKSQTDSEFGGKDFQANVAVAKRALDKYGSDDFKKAIEQTGMGNHPELIRFLYRVGKTVKEDVVMTDGGNTGGQKDAAKLLFPTMNS